MSNLLDKIIAVHPELKNQNFVPSEHGTKHDVFISDNFVVRIRNENLGILRRESDFLLTITYPLVPKVLWSGDVEKAAYVVESRLRGETLQNCWKDLKEGDRESILSDFVNFLLFLRSKTFDNVYSIKTGKTYSNFYDFLTDSLDDKITAVSKQHIANDILKEIIEIIKNPEASGLFTMKSNNLIHGDLIFHNLLTDGHHLTGVLDWELASTGDPDYDIFRLMNFQKSAKIYLDEGIDKYFEHDYLDSLLSKISQSKIANFQEEAFKIKYEICRSIYYLDALFWAVNSNDPENNTLEVIKEYQSSLKE